MLKPVRYLFADLIIKLLICRAYANNINKKPITAHDLLTEAENMIDSLRRFDQMSSSHSPQHLTSGLNYCARKELKQSWHKHGKSCDENIREGASTISIDILQQKLLLHRGLVFVTQGSFEQAKICFVDCINTRKKYDPRIRLECCK